MTTAGRDRSIDALRAYAVVAVVAGHWLVTGLPADAFGLSVDSPLRHLPDLAPLSWVFQALAPFFCAAGFAAARTLDRRPDWGAWLRIRSVALLRAVAALVAVWTGVLGALLLAGYPVATVHRIGKLVVSPLWFLAVLVVLWVAWPLLHRLDRRLRWYAAVPTVAVVAVSDLAQYGGHGTPLLFTAALICAWAGPFLVGIRLARGGFPRRGVALGTTAAGLLATWALISLADYPVSAVGVPGIERSNLGPPSLVAVTLGASQLGLFLALRSFSWPTAGEGLVGGVNRYALPVFLWHQSALLLLVVASARFAPVPGLVARPDDLTWVVQRLACFPALFVALGGLVWLGRPRPAAGKSVDARSAHPA